MFHVLIYGILEKVPPKPQQSKFRNLPGEEQEIARRIAQCRRYRGETQENLANLIGITRDQVASIETARVTLPFGLALKFADVLNVNLRWLAEGIKPANWYLEVSPSRWRGEIEPYLLKQIKDDGNFLTEYKLKLRSFFHEKFAEVEADFEKKYPRTKFKEIAELLSPGGEITGDREDLVSNLEPVIKEEMNKLSPILQYELAMKIGKVLGEFLVEYKEEIKKFTLLSPPPSQSISRQQINNLKVGFCKDNLDTLALPANLASMKSEVPTWPELKEDIKKMTAERGAKKALADEIKVSRQVLGNWLSDDAQGAPNADLTLELLKRVKQWKRKK